MQTNFEPFQKVLVRNFFSNGDAPWVSNIFSHFDESSNLPYACIYGQWQHCIPYEGNEHLLGSTDAPKKKHVYQWGDKVEVYIDGLWLKALYHCRSLTMSDNHLVYIDDGDSVVADKDIRPMKQEPPA